MLEECPAGEPPRGVPARDPNPLEAFKKEIEKRKKSSEEPIE
jgi:hypothetical protein